MKTSSAAAELKSLVLKTLDDGKALDIVEIDLAGKSSIADYMIIASGTSSRQIASLARKVMEDASKAFPDNKQRVEGLSEADWVLVDLQDIVVHLFRPEVRQFYALEKMWAITTLPTVEKRVMGKKLPE
jgi:ribosome-associated protein